MGSYKWGYTSTNMGYKHSYPTYNPAQNYTRTDPFQGGRLITLLISTREPPSELRGAPDRILRCMVSESLGTRLPAKRNPQG